MYVDPDSDTNAALVTALYESAREISDHVTFDWDRDGSYDHAYSNLSKTITDATLERAKLTSDLPEGVNVIQGYSSAELSLTLQGYLESEIAPVTQLLSPFMIGSEFYNQDLTGVGVRYWKRIYLDSSGTDYVDIRQFTGVINDIQFHHSSATVEINCSDVMKWQNADVTLPNWAVDATSMQAIGMVNGGTTRVINASWPLTEALRQAGTPVGPTPRSDAKIYVSGMGSFIPSIGQTWNDDSITKDTHVLPLTAGALWVPGQYGPWMKSVPTAQKATQAAFQQLSPSTPIVVPRNATIDGPVNVGLNVWASSTGIPTTNRTHPYVSSGGVNMTYNRGNYQMLGLAAGGAPAIVFQVDDNGQAYLMIASNDFSEIYTWTWAFKSAGNHYYDINIAFRNNSMTPTLRVDGVVQTSLTGSPVGKGYIYGTYGFPRDELMQWYALFVSDSAQHFQVYSGGSTTTYIPGQQLPPTTDDGLPWVIFSPCDAELSYLPDVWNVKAWDIIQGIAAAEFAGLYTNEWGQLVYRPHNRLRLDTPSTPSATYTVDNLMDLIVNPSLDQYKNRLIVGYNNSSKIPQEIMDWQHGQEFHVPDTAALTFSSVYKVEGVTRIARELIYLSGHNPEDIDDPPGFGNRNVMIGIYNWYKKRGSWTSAIFDNNTTKDGLNESHNTADTRYWSNIFSENTQAVQMTSFAQFLNGDQRQIRLMARVQPDARVNGLYIGGGVLDPGADVNDLANVNIHLIGMVIQSPTVDYYVTDSDSAIADRGLHSIIIEATDWRQTIFTAQTCGDLILPETLVPSPVISGIQIPSDPRLQITDVIGLIAPNGISGVINAQILGITRDAAGGTDTLEVRLTTTPSKWVLGQAGNSEVGQTTVLN